MDFDRDTFATTWERLAPTLPHDPVMRLAQWESSIAAMHRIIETAWQESDTIEDLFRRLLDPDRDLRVAYGAMRVLLALSDPAAQPVERIDGDVSLQPNEMRVILGDAIIAGSLKWTSGAVIVLGNLHIAGIYADDFETNTRLLVGGSVTTRGMATFGNVVIRHDLHAAEIVYGVGNDYSLIVGGTLQTKYVVSQYHNIQYETLDARGVLDEYQDIAQLRKNMVPELIISDDGSEDTFDGPALVERLADDLPIYR